MLSILLFRAWCWDCTPPGRSAVFFAWPGLAGFSILCCAASDRISSVFWVQNLRLSAVVASASGVLILGFFQYAPGSKGQSSALGRLTSGFGVGRRGVWCHCWATPVCLATRVWNWSSGPAASLVLKAEVFLPGISPYTPGSGKRSLCSKGLVTASCIGRKSVEPPVYLSPR